VSLCSLLINIIESYFDCEEIDIADLYSHRAHCLTLHISTECVSE
jgi:hypothetical protein